jgi:hypothetical protein
MAFISRKVLRKMKARGEVLLPEEEEWSYMPRQGGKADLR